MCLADPDLWGHLRFGLDILHSGEIPDSDPYSYTSGAQRWINHEWLTEVLLALAWSAGGATGLVLLKTAVSAATFAMLARHLVALGIHPIRVLILLVPIGLPMLPFLAQARPPIFTLLLFTLELVILHGAERGRYRPLWALPLVFAAWVNLHGGFLAGAGMLALWTVAHAALHPQQRWRVFAPAIAAAAATLLNPYGPGLLAFLIHTATVPRPEIADWQPLALMSPFGPLYVIVIGMVIGGLFVSRKPRQWLLLALCALTALLPWLAVRHLGLFCITAAVFAGEHIADAWERSVGSRGAAAQLPTSKTSAALTFAAALLVLWLGASRGVFTRVHAAPGAYPVNAVALLAQSGVTGKLAIEFGWGEYALWHLSPRIKVGIDGRRETLYTPTIYRQYLDFRTGRGDWDRFIRERVPDMALVKKDQPAFNLLKLRPDWRLIFTDDRSALFARRDAAITPRLQAVAAAFILPPEPGYFP